MTDNKEPIWITIPEENSSVSVNEAVKPIPKKKNVDKVENKIFWGIGLVALLVFASILLVPQQFTSLLKAQLFDGYQVVPDYGDQNETFPEEVSGEEEAPVQEEEIINKTLPEPESDAVVKAESDAVTIQIEPITEAEEFAVKPTDSAEGDVTAKIADETEIKEADVTNSTESELNDLGVSPDLQKLLTGLSTQLEQLKEDVRQKDQDILDLTTLLQDQAIGLYGAAPLTGQTQPIVGTTTDGITVPAPVSIPSALNRSFTPGGGIYRYNTHTVTASPYDILAQNQLATAPFQGQIAANIQGAVLPYSNQNFNSILSKVQAQPETGPGGVMLVALMLTSISVLGFGAMKAIKA